MSMASLILDPGRANRGWLAPKAGATALTVAASLAIATGVAVCASPATAQQPLEVFLAAADEHALDLREAELARDQARSQVDEARARWLPSFSATGGYTRNEVAVEVDFPTGATTSRQATITPLDQLDLTLQLNVPVIDVAS